MEGKNMTQTYQFKVALDTRRDLWRCIEIKGDQTLRDFDYILRDVFHHDHDDHLSEFFRGRPWHSEGFGEITPAGDGEGADKQISTLELSTGDRMMYVYDFGDDIQHNVTLEKITDLKKRVEYPRVIAKNKPKYRNCEKCLNHGKKKKAVWLCFSHVEEKELLLCTECLNKERDDCWVRKIVY